MVAPIEGKQWWIKSNQGQRQKRPVTLAAVKQEAFVNERTEAEARLKEAIEASIELLAISVQGMLDTSGRKDLSWNEPATIYVIKQLCDLIGCEAPQFDFAPKFARSPSGSHCINCGGKLAPEEHEWCVHCEPEQLKSQRMALARDYRTRQTNRSRYLFGNIKTLQADINKLRKKAREQWTQSRPPPTSA